MVQSYIYYILDDNIVNDFVYDKNTRQLIELQKQNPKIKSEYNYVFNDFEQGTGFDLINRLNKNHLYIIKRDAKMAIKVKNKYGKKNR